MENRKGEHHIKEATSCYSQILWQVFHLSDSEASRAAWPERVLDQLLSSLWSELQVLERTREQDQSCPLPFALAIRTYFRGFFLYLEGKAHSPCSWEIVRVEIQAALSAFPLSGRRSPRRGEAPCRRNLCPHDSMLSFSIQSRHTDSDSAPDEMGLHRKRRRTLDFLPCWACRNLTVYHPL
ncbi:interferon alpha-1-like [Grammomys surdaster]|uniref:interferon alpha-1-like n=1 Tax=Grammomys surdaster TaxID=491861 RepID=UPI00109F9618|nr:interferon alpha-1-like [Grammomys surdaster]